MATKAEKKRKALKKETQELIERYGQLTAIAGKPTADAHIEMSVGEQEWLNMRKPTPERRKEVRLRTAADMLKICSRMKTPNLLVMAALEKITKEEW